MYFPAQSGKQKLHIEKFCEPKIEFLPTYKLDEKDQYDFEVFPSYPHRIFYAYSKPAEKLI